MRGFLPFCLRQNLRTLFFDDDTKTRAFIGHIFDANHDKNVANFSF